MEPAAQEKDFARILYKRGRNYRKKLDNIKEKETQKKQGNQLTEKQRELLNQKEVFQNKFEEVENVLKMYQEFQQKLQQAQQIASQRKQKAVEESHALVELINATQILRFVQENSTEPQQILQSQEVLALLELGNKVLPNPSLGDSYYQSVVSSIEVTKKFIAKSDEKVQNSNLSYKQMHDVLKSVSKQIQDLQYPKKKVEIQIREVIKEIQVQVVIQTPVETPEPQQQIQIEQPLQKVQEEEKKELPVIKQQKKEKPKDPNWDFEEIQFQVIGPSDWGVESIQGYSEPQNQNFQEEEEVQVNKQQCKQNVDQDGFTIITKKEKAPRGRGSRW